MSTALLVPAGLVLRSLLTFTVHFVSCVFYVSLWNPISQLAMYMWHRLVAWYYKIDDYRDVPYTPIPLETVCVGYGDAIVTRYIVPCCGKQEFLLIQGASEQCLPTADEIRELVATANIADEYDASVLQVKKAIIDVDQEPRIDISSVLQSAMGPFNCHLHTYQQNAVSHMKSTDLISLFWQLALSEQDDVSTDEWSSLAVTIQMQHRHNGKIRQLATLDFLRHPRHWQHIYKPLDISLSG